MREDIERAFAPDGVLSQSLPEYEYRQAQVNMSLAVDETFEQDGDLIVEAGTGTGKSIAYVIPALTRSSLLIISTSNIALQRQLIEKDLPLLSDNYKEFKFAIAKGRKNYLCKRMHANVDTQTDMFSSDTLDNPQDIDQRRSAIMRWGRHTVEGDVEELPFKPGVEWEGFSCTSGDCHGKDCQYLGQCHVTQARERLNDCQVIVCNHHLLMASTKAQIFNEYEYLVCDEGHTLASVARQFFGWDIGPRSFERLISAARSLLRKGTPTMGDPKVGMDANDFDTMREAVRDAFADIGHKILKQKDSMRLSTIHKKVFAPLREVAERIKELLGIIRSYDFKDSALYTDVDKKYDQAKDLVNKLSAMWKVSSDQVVFVTKEQYRIVVSMRTIDVSGILADKLWRDRSCVVTSATLSVAGDFSYVSTDLGLAQARTMTVGSPFDFSRQSRLIVSGRAPNPKEMSQEEFLEGVSKVLTKVVELARGRTLGLFTSIKSMKHSADWLRSKGTPYTILCQGEDNRGSLIERFKQDESSVLLGVDSFWTGIDVPGPSLSCVFIDRLPFKRPGDPLWDAITEACEIRGGHGFMDLSLPEAAIKLRQGAGRLIRRSTDKGVVVIADSRIVRSGWGHLLLGSLAHMPTGSNLRKIGEFLESDH